MPTVWPIELPQTFLIDGFAQGFGKNLIRSNNDVGPAKIRRRSTAAPRPMNGSFAMTDWQLGVMVDFVNVQLEGGALPFYIKAQPPYVGTYFVRLAEELPQWDWLAPGYWKVDVKLEILPGAVEPTVPFIRPPFGDAGVPIPAIGGFGILEPKDTMLLRGPTLGTIAVTGPSDAASFTGDVGQALLDGNGDQILDSNGNSIFGS